MLISALDNISVDVARLGGHSEHELIKDLIISLQLRYTGQQLEQAICLLGELIIDLTVNEGNQYYFRNINWKGKSWILRSYVRCSKVDFEEPYIKLVEEIWNGEIC